MTPRAAELIETLRLEPHPEGGHYREIYRSAQSVDPADDRTARAALTVIYFLLNAGEVSRWHRVRSDEVWHYLEGDPLELQLADAEFEQTSAMLLSPLAGHAMPVRIIPADGWQAARTTGAYTLAACTVAPGFDFADFALLRDLPAEADRLNTRNPGLVDFL